MKFSEINKGDIVYEPCKYQRLTFEIEVLTQPVSKEVEGATKGSKTLQWTFIGRTADRETEFMETEAFAHYGVELTKTPEYNFPIRRLNGETENFEYDIF